MTSITFGRRLIDGKPVGEGVTIDADGPAAELLRKRTSFLISNPVVGEWAVALTSGEDTNGAYERGLGFYSPTSRGPPEHVHPNHEERFEVVEGTFAFTIDGEDIRLGSNEELTVPPGTPHTFRNEATEIGAFVAELRPASAVNEVIATLAGLAHDGKLSDSGRPDFLQAVLMGAELADHTAFTATPPSIQRLFATVLGPFARRRGYRAIYPRYLDESFWESRVEQPPWPRRRGERTSACPDS